MFPSFAETYNTNIYSGDLVDMMMLNAPIAKYVRVKMQSLKPD